MKPCLRALLIALLLALPAQAQDGGPFGILERRELPLERTVAFPTHTLRLTLAQIDGSGWAPESIHIALGESAKILGQCGIILEKTELILVRAPERYRDFHSPRSRELARALPLEKPTVYFVAGTRQRPAFEAEAIGRGNSRTRPELADTVWVTRGTRDLGIALAHELAHILMDSGEHSDQPGNLMRDETAPESTRLSAAQCAQMRETATSNGLLRYARRRDRSE